MQGTGICNFSCMHQLHFLYDLLYVLMNLLNVSQTKLYMWKEGNNHEKWPPFLQ